MRREIEVLRNAGRATLKRRAYEGTFRAPLLGAINNIFFYLRAGGLRLTELAERAHTAKQAMRYTVNQLEAAGYVECVPASTDGRAKIIYLTERGWAARRLADEIIESIEGECVRQLGEQRMRQFEGLMKEVTSVLEENQ